MTAAQKLAAAKGITLRAAYLRLHAAGKVPAGAGPGKPRPMLPGLSDALAAAYAARQQWGQALSPRDGEHTIEAICSALKVERTAVQRWLRGLARPAAEHQPAVLAWCRKIIREAARLAKS